MKTSLDHLPDAKRRELAHVVRVLMEEFESEIAGATQLWKKRGRIVKVILYGSYARGDWVDDPVGGYKSDYDILVVVNDPRLTDPVEYWSRADDRLVRDATVTNSISAPVNFIVHDFGDVNSQLAQGRPFFVDIVRQGIALYEAEGFPLTQSRTLSAEEARAEAQTYFERWFPSAEAFLASGQFLSARGNGNEAAFNFHQAAERLYHCALLVLTLYSPKSHKLNFLRGQAEDLAPELIEAWPRADRFSRRCFELLRQAYVSARYSPHYKVSDEELAWLAERVAKLQALVRSVCERKLAPPDL